MTIFTRPQPDDEKSEESELTFELVDEDEDTQPDTRLPLKPIQWPGWFATSQIGAGE